MSHHNAHKDFFNHAAKNWELEESRDKINYLRKIFNGLPFDLQGEVLDIGCGTGILVPVILEKCLSKCHILEVDFSIEMLRMNENRWWPQRKQVSQINADAYSLPFANKSCYTVICFAMLPHLIKPQEAMEEWYRILRPSGYLLILHLMSSDLLNRYHAGIGKAVKNDRLPPISETARMLINHNFKVTQTEERSDLYFILAQKL